MERRDPARERQSRSEEPQAGAEAERGLILPERQFPFKAVWLAVLHGNKVSSGVGHKERDSFVRLARLPPATRAPLFLFSAKRRKPTQLHKKCCSTK